MKPNSKVNTHGPAPRRAAWFICADITIGGADYLGQTSDTALDAGLAGILARLCGTTDAGQEVTILVDEETAGILRLRMPRYVQEVIDAEPDQHPVRRELAALGWQSSRIGFWSSFWAEGRPTVYVGQLDQIELRAARDPLRWPFAGYIGDTIAGLQRWHELTGIAWHAEPAVMGIELLHRNLPSFRLPGIKGNQRPAKTDPGDCPDGAGESVWTPDMWRRPWRDVVDELGTGFRGTVYLHKYDKTRAGMVAAGNAKLSPARLTRTRGRRYDPTRAGWWLISKPPWNDARLPHPAGPTGQVWDRICVATPTMDLLAELAEQGRLDFPDPIDSWTGPARPVLAKWYRRLADAYEAPVTDRYHEADQGRVQAAVRECATRGIGMLAHEGSSIMRRDWFAGVAATKRANGWRKADEIARVEGRYPVMIDDDALTYASTIRDPHAAAPRTFSTPTASGTPRQLDGDQPGDYRFQDTVTKETR